MFRTANIYRGMIPGYVHLILPLGLLFGWMLSFPMGQCLYALSSVKGINPDMLFKVFLVSHFTGLIVFGFTLNRLPFKKGLLILSLLVPVLFTAGLALMPGNYIIFLSGFCGFAITPFIINWATSFVSNTDSRYRCRVMAMTIILANIILFIYTLLISFISIGWLALSGCLPSLLLVVLDLKLFFYKRIKVDKYKTNVLRFRNVCSVDSLRITSNIFSVKGLLSLLLMVLIFNLTAGYMYGEMFRKHFAIVGPLIFSFSIFPYIVATMLAGYLGDFINRKVIIHSGLVCLGVSIVIFPSVSGLWGFFLSETPIQVAYGFFDVFLWTTLADIAEKYPAERTYGVGLGLNVFLILVGIILNDFLVQFNYSTLMPILILIVIFIGVALLLGLENIYLPQKSARINMEGFPFENLTLREKEVAMLIIQGKLNKEIADKLSISENTVKTHIRNILKKSGASNKLKFLTIINDSNSD